MTEMSIIAGGVFLTVLGMNAWGNFPPDLAQLAQAAACRKAIFLTVSGGVLSTAGAVRALIRVRGNKS
jgi:hypothetical protein